MLRSICFLLPSVAVVRAALLSVDGVGLRLGQAGPVASERPVASRVLLLALVLTSAVACSDKARPAYERCVELHRGADIDGAWGACNEAVRADLASEAGRAAAAKLEEMKPAYQAKKAQDEAAAEKRRVEEEKAAAERAAAAAEAQKKRVAALRAKVRPKWIGFDPDGDCTGKGLPPYRKAYEGGTYDEDELVAYADGCQHLFTRRNSMNDVYFCCPQ
ncbi:MAG TPA: hypothetical protein VFS43_21160 [Polyangiaceae bacterium]|nr:hypothetical protein [Polyangiaceae bacterium]